MLLERNIHFLMFLSLLSLFLLCLSGCGAMQSTCNGDLKHPCQALFGFESERNDQQDDKLKDIANRVARIEQDNANNINLINNLSLSITGVNANLAALSMTITSLSDQESDDVDYLESLIAAQLSLINSLSSNISTLQDNVNDNNALLVELQTDESIDEFVDPCGDSPGFDEVLVRTRTGKLIAFFESGSQRFLSVLTPGSYVTTDASSCHFVVSASLMVIDNTGTH